MLHVSSGAWSLHVLILLLIHSLPFLTLEAVKTETRSLGVRVVGTRTKLTETQQNPQYFQNTQSHVYDGHYRCDSSIPLPKIRHMKNKQGVNERCRFERHENKSPYFGVVRIGDGFPFSRGDDSQGDQQCKDHTHVAENGDLVIVCPVRESEFQPQKNNGTCIDNIADPHPDNEYNDPLSGIFTELLVDISRYHTVSQAQDQVTIIPATFRHCCRASSAVCLKTPTHAYLQSCDLITISYFLEGPYGSRSIIFVMKLAAGYI